MKSLFLNIIVCFSFLNVYAVSTDSLLIKEYEAGCNYVNRIIEKENLSDSLSNRDFCSIFFENIWAITVKKDNSFVLYYGFRTEGGKTIRKEIPADNSLLARLFLLDSKNIKESVNKKRDYYTPIYWYFVLEDSKHIKKYEWSEYTTSDDEYAKNSLDAINDYIGYLFTTSNEDENGKAKIEKDCQYWDDLDENSKSEIIKSIDVDNNIMKLYLHEIKLSDNDMSAAILDTLCSSTDGYKRMLYFYVLNENIKNADGAISEMLGGYCIKYVNENTDYALEYFSKHQNVANNYADMIAAELYLSDTSISQYKQPLLHSAKSKRAKEYLPIFLKEIERILAKID